MLPGNRGIRMTEILGFSIVTQCFGGYLWLLSSGGVGKKVLFICGLGLRLAVANEFYLNRFSSFHISPEDRGRFILKNVVNVDCGLMENVQNFSRDLDHIQNLRKQKQGILKHQYNGTDHSILIWIWYDMMIWYIFSCNWVDTRWQRYSSHLHTNSTPNTKNGTYITITKLNTHNNKNLTNLWSAGRAPSLWVIPRHLPYNWGKSTEKPQ